MNRVCSEVGHQNDEFVRTVPTDTEEDRMVISQWDVWWAAITFRDRL
jgi:hypothetical protein